MEPSFTRQNSCLSTKDGRRNMSIVDIILIGISGLLGIGIIGGVCLIGTFAYMLQRREAQ